MGSLLHPRWQEEEGGGGLWGGLVKFTKEKDKNPPLIEGATRKDYFADIILRAEEPTADGPPPPLKQTRSGRQMVYK